MHADLGKISNGIYRRWARAFLRSIRRSSRRLRKVQNQGFESIMHDTYPCELSLNRFKRVQRAATTASKSRSKREPNTLKHGLEVPRNWKDIVRIDAEAGNRHWQDAV